MAVELNLEQFDALSAMIKAEARVAYTGSLVNQHPKVRVIRERFEAAKVQRDTAVDNARTLLLGLT